MLLCGIDEAGRGPLAGPVTAAAVILPPDFPIEILDDSKRLTPARREAAARVIRARALAWATGWAWPAEIDRLNILQASLLAMQRAVYALPAQPGRIVVDGPHAPNLACECRPIVGGDGLEPAIMAASILAKTSRDRWMVRYARIEPDWRFEVHKGYPTPQHRELLRLLGPSPIHRLSFRPVSPS